jgi:hypothetical protein
LGSDGLSLLLSELEQAVSESPLFRMDGTSSCSFPFSSSLFLHAALLPHAFIVNDLLHHASFPVWAYIWRIKQLQRPCPILEYMQ